MIDTAISHQGMPRAIPAGDDRFFTCRREDIGSHKPDNDEKRGLVKKKIQERYLGGNDRKRQGKLEDTDKKGLVLEDFCRVHGIVQDEWERRWYVTRSFGFSLS
jgi:hypothetical protein